jgi:hypothetical protein
VSDFVAPAGSDKNASRHTTSPRATRSFAEVPAETPALELDADAIAALTSAHTPNSTNARRRLINDPFSSSPASEGTTGGELI